MKTFIKILRIIAWFVGVAYIIFTLFICFLALISLFSSDTPEGCDPSMPTSACDYIDEKFEKELQIYLPSPLCLPKKKDPYFGLEKADLQKA